MEDQDDVDVAEGDHVPGRNVHTTFQEAEFAFKPLGGEYVTPFIYSQLLKNFQ